MPELESWQLAWALENGSSDVGERHPQPLVVAEGVSMSLFGLTALLAAQIAFRVRRSSFGAAPVNAGTRMRCYLALCLFAANVVRCLALAAQLALQEGLLHGLVTEELTPGQLQWVWDLISLLPAVVFLSAFSVVVLFWAQLHYTTTIVPLPLLDCLFVCVNIAGYLLVAAIAVCTFVLKAYDHLRTYMTCIIGFLNAVVSLSLFYYGLMVVSELAEMTRKKLPGKRLTLRILVLSVACPITLLARGATYLAWGLSLAKPSPMADLCLCLACEWLPSVVALVVVNPLQQRAGPGSPTDSLDDSTDSEAHAPLLHDEPQTPPRSLAGAPGGTWKQLYPQP